MWACRGGTPTCVFGGGAAEPYECCPADDGRSIVETDKYVPPEDLDTWPSDDRWIEIEDETVIGENGSTLSGGERQRISIARALLKDAPVILLDEATASLDVENESAVQAALSRLVRDKTVLIIAHRMRTVAGADRIVVLENGKVAQQGSPDQLMKQGGLYRHMVELQKESSAWTLGNG